MPSFRIFYFRHNVLQHAEEHELRDILDAIEKASLKDPEVKAEIWSGNRRIGVIGSVPGALQSAPQVLVRPIQT
jgi:hypothetical protein